MCVRRPHLYGSIGEIQKYALFEEVLPDMKAAATENAFAVVTQMTAAVGPIIDKSTCVHVALVPPPPGTIPRQENLEVALATRRRVR